MTADAYLDHSERTERLDEIQQAMKQAVREALIRHKREHPQFLDENWIKRRNLSSKNHNLLKLI